MRKLLALILSFALILCCGAQTAVFAEETTGISVSDDAAFLEEVKNAAVPEQLMGIIEKNYDFLKARTSSADYYVRLNSDYKILLSKRLFSLKESGLTESIDTFLSIFEKTTMEIYSEWEKNTMSSGSSSGGGGGTGGPISSGGSSIWSSEGYFWGTCTEKNFKTGEYTVAAENGDIYKANQYLGFSVGDEGWFKPDDSGNITEYKEIPYSGFNIGWLSHTGASVYQSTGEESLLFKIFITQSYTFDMADTLILNGTEYTDTSEVYKDLKDYKGAVAFKYDSTDALRYYRITELETLDAPLFENTETCYDAETNSLSGMEGYEISDNTEIIFTGNAEKPSKLTLKPKYVYTVSAFAYDRNFNIRLITVSKSDLTNALFFTGDMSQNASGTYISGRTSNGTENSYKLSESCILDGKSFNNAEDIYAEFASFEGLIFTKTDTSGNICSIETKAECENFNGLSYDPRVNGLGKYSLENAEIFEAYDYFNSIKNRISDSHYWSLAGGNLSDSLCYSGSCYDFGGKRIIYINEKSPKSGLAPSVKFTATASYEDAPSDCLTAYAEIEQNGYTKGATVIIAAYLNGVLKETETAKADGTADILSLSVKKLDGYTFRCFVLDENYMPLDTLPVYTSELAKKNNDSQAITVDALVTANSYTRINGTKTINTERADYVDLKIYDSFGTKNSDFAFSEEDTNLGFLIKPDILTGKSNAGELIGRRIIAKIAKSKTEPDEYEILSASLNSEACSEVSFTLDDLVSTSAGKIEYYNGENLVSARLSANACAVFNNNGGYTFNDISSIVLSNIDGLSGRITLVDNDADGTYNIIFVEAGSPAIVDSTDEEKISFGGLPADMLMGTPLSTIYLNDNTLKVIIKKGDKEISPSELKKGDVLSVIADTKNSSYIVCELIENTVTGTVTETKESYSSLYGIAYKIGDSFYDVNQLAYYANGIEIGDKGIFHIDKYGKIVLFTEDPAIDSASSGYGYVLKTAAYSSSIDGTEIQFKLLTKKGIDAFRLADKTTIYGISASGNADEIIEGAKTTKITNKLTNGSYSDLRTWASTFAGKVIKYTLSSKGEITSITLAGYNLDKFSMKHSETDAEFDKDLMKIGRQYIDKDAMVFLIDENNDSDCLIGTIDDLDDGQIYSSCTSYLDSQGSDANIIVLTGYENISPASPIAVITSVKKGQNSDSEDIYLLDYYINGELKEGIPTNNDIYNQYYSLRKGEIVQIKVINGVIINLDSLVGFERDIRTENGIYADAAGTFINGAYKFTDVALTTLFGYTTEFSGGSKSVVLADEDYQLSQAENIYVIEPGTRNKDIRPGSLGDYTFDANLMADPVANIVTLYESKDKTGKVIGTDITAADAYSKYADYLFIREYDGIVKDVVIIKPYSDNYRAECILRPAE